MAKPTPALAVGPFMCCRCVDDDELKSFIRDNAVADQCSFCGRKSKSKLIAADADAVAELVAAYVLDEYDDASEMVPYESAEGGYIFRTMTSDELLQEEIGLGELNREAYQHIVGSLPDYAWVQKHFFSLTPFDELKYGWEGFASAVKHETRYLFFKPRAKDDWPNEGIRPEDMLAQLGRTLRRARTVRTLRAGTILYRVRPHQPEVRPSTLAELGPPPTDAAVFSNRMSPAGVSMLYAAEDEWTAIQETRSAGDKGSHATLATFRLLQDIKVVDLARLPRLRLFTGGYNREERAQLRFAHSFAREVSKPVAKDGREHIEYVPTQVVTEYLRFRFRSKRGVVRGLRYRSSHVDGGVNLAVFVGHDELTDTDEAPLLELVHHRKVEL